MTIKSILLGFAAGLVSLGAASAADLPMAKSEAVEYVKVCSAFGPGFFYIPGTDTCLQISGQIRADYFYTEPSTRKSNVTTFRSQTRIRFDARTQTDYGILRSFLELQADTNSLGTTQNGTTGTNFLSVRRAYIQFGGLTAGYAWSPYSFYEQYYQAEFFAPYFGEHDRRELLSYTAQFGKFWGALSVEDPVSNRSTSTFGSATVNSVSDTLAYGGSSVPDVVGVIGYDDNKNWGRVQIMAASHESNPSTVGYDSKYGYAVGIGGNLNFPIMSGAYIAVEASYADGAMKYLNAGSADAYGNPLAPHDLALSKGWTVQGEAGLNITPALQAVLFGGYLNYDAPSIATAVSDNFNFYVIGGQVNYTMVKGFIVGAEAWYQNKDPEGTSPNAHAIGAGIRIRRTF
ncbi:porin [Labrys monachus]|uniref:Porin n=1 Tax=Labrys monachus TaxID=217067 RepID=A0ABU0FJ31_9HYPH|nr:porin [Labrys monachus]MDQ0394050.1 hypothetical protein [Labrys monachus]